MQQQVGTTLPQLQDLKELLEAANKVKERILATPSGSVLYGEPMVVKDICTTVEEIKQVYIERMIDEPGWYPTQVMDLFGIHADEVRAKRAERGITLGT